MTSTNTPSLAMLLWAADLRHPERLATPFVMAQAAAALEVCVELYFSAQCVQLLTPAAGSLRIGQGQAQRRLSAYLQDAHDAGVHFFACSQALHAQGLQLGDLIPLCAGAGGAVQFMSRSVDPGWRSLVF